MRGFSNTSLNTLVMVEPVITTSAIMSKLTNHARFATCCARCTRAPFSRKLRKMAPWSRKNMSKVNPTSRAKGLSGVRKGACVIALRINWHAMHQVADDNAPEEAREHTTDKDDPIPAAYASVGFRAGYETRMRPHAG